MTEYVTIANLKGPRGFTGPQGLAGVNGVANDAATAGYIGTPGSATQVAGDARWQRAAAIVVRERTGGETHDGPAFDAALSAADTFGSGVVLWPQGRDITLPGGHVRKGRILVDFNLNRVTHTGNNTMLLCYDAEEGLTGIGEITGGIANVSVTATGAAAVGAAAAAFEVMSSWGFFFHNVEVFLYEQGLGIWMRNVGNVWTEGTLYDNVMLNACKTGVRYSVEDSTMPDNTSSFAYQQIKGLAINVPVNGVGIDLVSDGSAQIHLYQSELNVVFWLRQGSTAIKASHDVIMDKNTYRLVAEIQESATAVTYFSTVTGAMITGTGSVSTISTVETTMHTGAGWVYITNPAGDHAFDSRDAPRSGMRVRTSSMSDVDRLTGSTYIARSGWEDGANTERAWVAGYNGGNDVWRAYGIEFGSPSPADWRTYLGVGNGRLTIGGTSGTDVHVFRGTGSPAGVVVANRGSTFHRTDGGAGTSYYVKESGDGTSSGWVAK